MLKNLFHVDEREKWDLTLANVTNFLNADLKKAPAIQVVANAGAVAACVQGSDYQQDIEKLLQREVRFTVCRTALLANEFEETSVIDGIEVVPAGVVELARQQKRGYSYIKP